MTSATTSVPAAILVVEDDPLVRMVLADSLADAGYRVLEAESADEALRLLDDQPQTRVVITDVRMPGSLDGIELAHVVAQRCPDAAIVVVSGDATPKDGDLPPGAAFIPKPYILGEVRSAVGRLMERVTVVPIIPGRKIPDR